MKKLAYILCAVVLVFSLCALISVRAQTAHPHETEATTTPETTAPKITEPPVVVETTEPTEPEPEIDPHELEMLATVIYQEAGGDGSCDKCRRYVADIVLNRVEHEKFPNTI